MRNQQSNLTKAVNASVNEELKNIETLIKGSGLNMTGAKRKRMMKTWQHLLTLDGKAGYKEALFLPIERALGVREVTHHKTISSRRLQKQQEDWNWTLVLTPSGREKNYKYV